MTETTTPVDEHDPDELGPSAESDGVDDRSDRPRCAICGEPMQEGMAGWEHVAPADHEAAGRDEE